MAERLSLSADRLTLLRLLVEKEGLSAVPQPILAGPRPEPLPLSFAQQRLWFLDRLLPASAVYNIAAVLELRGRLDLAAMEFAISELVARQESLRTSFPSVGGVPEQLVHPPARVVLEPMDLTGLRPDQRRAEAERICAQAARQPFDLSTPTLYRLALVRLSPREHWLSTTLHHIIADGWSIGVMTHDLCELYQAFLNRTVPRLRDLPAQYADYALWERRQVKGAYLSEQTAYWRSRLSESPAALELPFDRPRGRLPSHRGELEIFSLSAELSRRLRELSRAEGSTLFTTLLAAFHLLLARYTGRSDTVIGTAVANRSRPEIEGLIGFFVNTVALRIESRPELTFRSLLRRVGETVLDDFAHATLPFEKLVEELDPARDRSLHPLFQVMFVLQNAPREPLELPGLRAGVRDVDTGAAKFDYLLSITDRPAGLVGSVEYDAELFERSTIARTLRHFENLLASAVEAPDRPVSELSLMSDVERSATVSLGLAPSLPADDRCVHHLFEKTALRRPSAPAVSCGDERLSYEELNTWANRLAHHLRAMGAGPEDVIGVSVERSLAMAVAVLGILKAGAAYLPLDPAYPRARLDFMRAEAGASIVLTASSPELDLARRRAGSDDPPADRASPLNLAYVIYTSGSTGRPKGVCMTHAVLVNLMRWQRTALPDPPRRTLQFASLSFDVSFIEMFTAWCGGGEVVIYPGARRRDPAELAGFIAAARIDFTMLPAAVLEPLAEALAVGGPDRLRLRDVVSTAERLRPTPALMNLLRLLPDCTLHNHYGPSETSVVTAATLPRDPPSWPATPPIGRPISGAGVYILDARMEPVPIGVPGELYATGRSLARGYWRGPARTAQRFLPDPFSPAPGARMYRTGDAGRWLADGNVAFLGRLDHQVKVRGFRIEPAEIEAALNQHPAVSRSLVVTAGESAAAKRLLAYVVATSSDAARPAELRSFLTGLLPGYMIPSAFVSIDAFPLNANGKVDLERLPAPSSQPVETTREARPRNPLEELLCCIWADVLSLPRVGIFDSFFDLGGHSLLVTQLVARVRAALGVELTFDVLFADSRVAAVARRLPGLAPADRTSPIPPAPRDEPQPLGPAQEGFWALERLMPGSPLFNQPLAVRIAGPLDVEAWERCVELVVDRHGALRTVFRLDGDSVLAFAVPGSPVRLEITDLSALPADEREKAVIDATQDEAATGFDLRTGPLLRARLLRLGPEDHVALFTTHHIIADGWTHEILRREIEQAYPLFAAAAEYSPPPPPQYADYLAWERKWIAGETCALQLAYWRERLRELRDCALPLDHPRPEAMVFGTRRLSFELPEATTTAVRELAHKQSLTPFIILLAAWKVCAFALTGETDQRVGTLIANRSQPGLEDICGLLVNTVTLRTELAGALDFATLLARVRTTTLEAYANQHVPFDMVVEALEADGQARRAEVFRVLISWEERLSHPLHLPGLAVRPFVVEEEGAVDVTPTASDLWIVVASQEGKIVAHFTYKVALFESASVRRWWTSLCSILERALATPQSRLSDLVGTLELGQ